MGVGGGEGGWPWQLEAKIWFLRTGQPEAVAKMCSSVALRGRVKTISRPAAPHAMATAQRQSPKINVERLNYHLKLSWPDLSA